MTALTDAAREELARLEAELAADPRYQKITSLRELLKLYSEPAGAALTAALVSSRRPVRAPRTSPTDPGRLAALEAVRQMLRTATEPVRTSFLFDLLPEEISSKIGGKEPMSNLSAMMSKSPWFKSHGRRGWTLADDDDEPIISPATADDFDDLMKEEPLA